MGKTYLFACPRCDYRAQVSGRADRGFGLCVETIVCRDCKRLYDVVVRLRVGQKPEVRAPTGQKKPNGKLVPAFSPENAPSFSSALNRLPSSMARSSQWVEFKKRCPVSPLHRIRSWIDPEKCPQCGTYLERAGLPYRIWD
jgi:hypothetical protein